MENLAPSNVTIKSSKTIEEIYQKKVHALRVLLMLSTLTRSHDRPTWNKFFFDRKRTSDLFNEILKNGGF